MIPRRIGVFDSGVGGISVLKNLIDSSNFEEIIYYGDTARVPYGTRSKETIIQYSLEALEFFGQFKLDLLVVACNTISAYGLESMQKATDYPIVGVIEPGVLALTNNLQNKNAKILVLGTKATIQSQLYQKLLKNQGYSNVSGLATSLFVPLVEEGIFGGEILESVMEYYFKNYEGIPDAIILGCTHFPLIARAIEKYYQNKLILKGDSTTPNPPILIHSGIAIMEYLKAKYTLQKSDNPPKIAFYASDNLEKLKSTADLWLSNQ